MDSEENDTESKSENKGESDGFICEVCSKICDDRAQLKQHMATHSEMRFSCPFCDKIFKTKDGVKTHVRVHTGERPFVCSHCGKTFADASSRAQHERYQHPTEEAKFFCEECGKQFANPRNLQHHMVLHQQGKEYDGTPMRYSNELKVEALKLVKEVGKAETARRLNLPYSAIRNWETACKKKFPCTFCGKELSTESIREKHEKAKHSLVESERKGPKRFTDEFKKEVIEFAKQNSNKQACLKYDLAESTVRRLVKVSSNPFPCPYCTRQCSCQRELDRHISEVHMKGKDTGFNYQKTEHNFKDYLERENIDAEELAAKESDTKHIDIDPRNIVKYDPNEPKEVPKKKEPKPKVKRIRKKAPPRKKSVKEEVKVEVEEEEQNDDKKVVLLSIKNEGKPKNYVTDSVSEDENSNMSYLDASVDNDNNLVSSSESEDEKITTENGNNIQKNDNSAEEDFEKIKDDLLKFGNDEFHEFQALLNNSHEFVENVKEEAESDHEVDPGNTIFPKTELEIKEECVGNDSSYENIKAEEKALVKVQVTEKKKRKRRKNSDIEDGDYQKKKKKKVKKQKSEEDIQHFDLKEFSIEEEGDEMLIMSHLLSNEPLIKFLYSKQFKAKMKRFKCVECGKEFKTRCDMKRHLAVHFDDKSFQCSLCPTMFKLKQNLVRHVQMYHSDNWEGFSCSVCGKWFREKAAMQLHEVRHTDAKPHQCSLCGLKYSDKASMEKHIFRVHEGHAPVKFTCSDCGKMFLKKHEFREHCEMHINGKPKCDTCGKEFEWKSALSKHKMIHLTPQERKNVLAKDKSSGLKQCKICDKMVVNMKRHMQGHNDERNFHCNECGKSYIDKKSLNNHRAIIHEGKVDNFFCKICNKSFTRRTGLAAHMLLHTGKGRLFNCKYCNSSYKEKRNLVNHLERNHHINPDNDDIKSCISVSFSDNESQDC